MGIDKEEIPNPDDALKLREWLANDMEKPLPDFITHHLNRRGYLSFNGFALDHSYIKECYVKSKIGLVYDSKLETKKVKPRVIQIQIQ